jgi:hypothetical protein
MFIPVLFVIIKNKLAEMPTVNRGVNINIKALILRINILYSLKCDRSQ